MKKNLPWFRNAFRLKLVEAQGGHMTRSNWYFQQFLKMAYAFICEDDYYIIWDADTVPVRTIELFQEDKPLFSFVMTTERIISIHWKTFHEHIKKQSPKSFIVEHMVIKTSFYEK